MRIRVPMTFAVDLDEGALQDFLIDLGAAKQRQERAVPGILESNSALQSFIVALDRLQERSEAAWDFLQKNIQLTYPAPDRLREVICVASMCRFFQYEALVVSAQLSGDGEQRFYRASVAIQDRNGKQLVEAPGSGPWFAIGDPEGAMSSLLGAFASGFRDAGRQLFPFGAHYDELDDVVTVDPETGTPRG